MKTKSLQNNEIYREQIIEEMVSKFNLDKRVLREVCYYPIRFTKRVMEDPADPRPIRIRYFGVFTQKNKFNKDKHMKDYYDKLMGDIENVTLAMVLLLGYELPTYESTRNVLDLAYKTKDYAKLQDIYDAWKEYIK